MKTQSVVQSNRQHAGHYRTAVCRFHNSLYLGCVIGVLLGFGFAESALAWPKRAWRRAHAGSSPLGSATEVVHAAGSIM